MAERELFKSKELEAHQVHSYEDIFKQNAAKRERAATGRIVIKGPELPWEKSRQAILKYYLHLLPSSQHNGYSRRRMDLLHSGYPQSFGQAPASGRTGDLRAGRERADYR